jgi:predicted nucleic acid-binding protein
VKPQSFSAQTTFCLNPTVGNPIKRGNILVKKTVKRDPNDDPVIMAAVAVRAAYIVTTDDDLLSLKKPYGSTCILPRKFLGAILRQP